MSAKFRILIAIGIAMSLFIGIAVVAVRVLPSTWTAMNKTLAKSIFRITDKDILNDELNYAAKTGDLKTVKALLAKGAAVDGRSMHYMTPLMSAAEGGKLEIMRLLLDKGADVNAHNDSGSVLMWAAASGNANAVRLLLKRKVNVQWKSDIGRSALTIAKEYKNSKIAEILKKAGAK